MKCTDTLSDLCQKRSKACPQSPYFMLRTFRTDGDNELSHHVIPNAEPGRPFCEPAVAKGNIVSVVKEKYLASVEVSGGLQHAKPQLFCTHHTLKHLQSYLSEFLMQ